MNAIDEILKLAAKTALVNEKADAETARFRMSVCLQCEKRDPIEERCKVCKCYLEPKTKAAKNWNVRHLRNEITHCPLGKWNDIEIANHYRQIDGKPLLPLK